MSELTRVQRDVLEFIASNISERGIPPTRPEISDHFGWHSANAAEDTIKILARKGYVETIRGVARGLRLTGKEEGQAAPSAAAPATPAVMRKVSDVASVPVRKASTHESEAWRRAVATLPCMLCGKEGETQCAHRNEGKGMAMKTDDALTAALCTVCHREIDQGSTLTREERRGRMDRAILLTIQRLARDGLIRA